MPDPITGRDATTIDYQSPAAPMSASNASAAGVGNLRWWICSLLFLATTINYVDRQVIALLKPILEKQYGWTETDYSNVVVAFQFAYAVGQFFVGGVIDRIGVKMGFFLAVALWSLAAAAHGLIAYLPADASANFGTLLGLRSTELVLKVGGLSILFFSLARIALGLAEAGNFPAAIKAACEWFPKKERALATGIFNCGANIGALTAPFAVPWIAVHFGWAWAFYITGALGAGWIVLWLIFYDSPDRDPRLSESERAYIKSDPPHASDRHLKLPWSMFLFRRQTIAFAIVKFLTDPIWWFYLFWIPSFLDKRHHVNILHLGPPILVIYMMTTVGSIGGGYLSSTLIARGFSVNVARKLALLICALCVVPIFAASIVSGLWTAVLLVGLAAAAHQGFSANIYTIVSDVTPKAGVSSVTGIGGMAGAVGGMVFASFIGYILDLTHENYLIPFAICSMAYLLAVLILQLLLPGLEPMVIDVEQGGMMTGAS